MFLEIEENERQMILLALAELSLSRPGFDYAINNIAMQFDNVENGRAKTYDEFRELNKDRIKL